MFTQAVIEYLQYYVYFLQDPRNQEVFYVGKGVGNRVFEHLNGAIESDAETDKLDTIREILASGNTVKHFILRHGLEESVAFEVEASMIDFIGLNNLSNQQGGHYSDDYGLKVADEITAMYEPEELSTTEPLMLININRLYRREMTDVQLYEATRGSWVVGRRRDSVRFAVATYRGLTREVYEISDWYSVKVDGKTRWAFNGIKANDQIREQVRYKSIVSYFGRGAANPIKYVNC